MKNKADQLAFQIAEILSHPQNLGGEWLQVNKTILQSFKEVAEAQRGACWLTLMEKACDISDESFDAISVLNTPLVTAKTVKT